MSIADQHGPFGVSISSACLRPSTHVLAGLHAYVEPFELDGVVKILGVVSGLDHQAAAYLQGLAERPEPSVVHLVVVLSPACRTDENVLRDLVELQESSGGRFHFRVSLHAESVTTPTNLIWAFGEDDEFGTVFLGADENLLLDRPRKTRLTLGFPMGARHFGEMLNWFEFVYGTAVPLTRSTCEIPELAHPQGTEDGRRLWEEYRQILVDTGLSERQAIVDPETGRVQVVDETGKSQPSLVEQGLLNQVDPVRRDLEVVFEKGLLLTAAAASRIPPLQVPLPPAMFEDRSSQTAGSVSRKSQYRLDIIPNEKTNKDIENAKQRCASLLRKFSFGVADGQRWVPDAARPLLQAEMAREDEKGRQILISSVGGSVDAFLDRERDRMTRDAVSMAKAMGKALAQGDDAWNRIMKEARERLEKAVSLPFAPALTEARYSPLIPPSGISGWAHVATFVLEVARLPREAISDPYFARGVKLLSTGDGLRQYLGAMDVFGDGVTAAFFDGKNVRDIAERELTEIKRIAESAEDDGEEVCRAILALIKARH